MKWFYFSILPLLCATKVTLQGFFSRGKVKTLTDSIKFNGFMFLFSALFLIIFTVRQLPSTQTIFCALVVALFSVSFQFFYVLAFKTGAVSLSSTIANFGVVIPIVFSAIAYQEVITTNKIIGFILIALAIILLPSSKNDKTKSGIKTPKIWLLYILIATILNGAVSTIQQSFSRSAISNEKELFTALIFVFASIYSFLLLLFVKGKEPLYKNDGKSLIGLGIIGLALGFYNLLAVSALAIIPSAEYFPTVTGLSILVTVMMSAITFKELPSKKQILGIAVATVAIVIINLV